VQARFRVLAVPGMGRVGAHAGERLLRAATAMTVIISSSVTGMMMTGDGRHLLRRSCSVAGIASGPPLRRDAGRVGVLPIARLAKQFLEQSAVVDHRLPQVLG
jgi:hypothetical protein